MSTESVLITATIDAHKRINVTIFNIPGAYSQLETNEDIIMVIEGVLDELMVKVDPLLNRKYVIVNSRCKSLLDVKIHKELYVLLRSVLLFY